MNETLTWSHDDADGALCGDTPEGFTHILTEDGDQERWSQHHTVIIKRDADQTYWSYGYKRGLTECQDGYYGAARYYGEPDVKLTQVYPHRIITVVYLDRPQD